MSLFNIVEGKTDITLYVSNGTQAELCTVYAYTNLVKKHVYYVNVIIEITFNMALHDDYW